MIDLGSAIRTRRERTGLSQLELALAVGYKNSSDISRVETGKQWPDAAKLGLIADTLQCDVWELFADAQGDRPRTATERTAPYAVERPQWQPATLPGGPPTLDDALADVRHFLTGGAEPELLAAIAYQGLMTRYATDQISSAVNSLVMAVESLRDDIATKK